MFCSLWPFRLLQTLKGRRLQASPAPRQSPAAAPPRAGDVLFKAAPPVGKNHTFPSPTICQYAHPKEKKKRKKEKKKERKKENSSVRAVSSAGESQPTKRHHRRHSLGGSQTAKCLATSPVTRMRLSPLASINMLPPSP